MTPVSPSKFDVLLTENAEQDLEEIYDYLTVFDSPAAADRILTALMDVVESLSTFPERGSYPKELLGLGIKEYRQTIFKPYRVIYRIHNHQVIIHLVADSRRHMESLLERRLFAA